VAALLPYYRTGQESADLGESLANVLRRFSIETLKYVLAPGDLRQKYGH